MGTQILIALKVEPYAQTASVLLLLHLLLLLAGWLVIIAVCIWCWGSAWTWRLVHVEVRGQLLGVSSLALQGLN